MNQHDVARRLGRLCAANEDPVLEQHELDEILLDARRPDAAGNLPTNTTAAAEWSASASVVAGDVVRSDARWWRALVPGTTGTTAPTWPTFEARPATFLRVPDGSTVWEDVGGAWAPTWDLNAAIAEAWETKAAKASCRNDVVADGVNIARSKLYARCLEMARTFRNRGAATVTTG